MVLDLVIGSDLNPVPILRHDSSHQARRTRRRHLEGRLVMSELIIVFVVAAIVASVWVLTKLAVSSDGYGRRRPPISHAPDMFDAGMRRVG